MIRFTQYLHKINKYDDASKRIINVFKRLNDLMTDNKKNYDDFNFLIKNKEKIRTWLLNNLATSSVVSYSIALRHAIQSMDISESEKEEMIRFYLDIAAEAQRVQNRILGRVARDFQPKRAIQEINEMVQNRPTFIVANPTEKVEKVVRAIPQWADSDAPILTQIQEFTETLTGPTGKLLRLSSKRNYKSKIKTIMTRLHYKNLDFLLTDVPGVLKFLNDVDNSKEGKEKYLARQSSRGYETAAVTYLPLARTNDPHDRVVCKAQYNEWLTHHKLLPTPGVVKDYGITWEDAVRQMQNKIKSSKNELHRLILSLYTDTPPRRSLDYSEMQINVPDDRETNILVFTPKIKKFIFNKYKISEKKGAQEIDIISPSLIKLLDEHLKKNPNQKYLLMRNNKALNDTQIREIVRKEIGSKEQQFGIRMIRRLFATFIIKEKDENPRRLAEYARKMGTSVQMLMSNYAQVPENEDKEEYKGLEDLSEEEEEPKPKKRSSPRTSTKRNKKAKK